MYKKLTTIFILCLIIAVSIAGYYYYQKNNSSAINKECLHKDFDICGFRFYIKDSSEEYKDLLVSNTELLISSMKEDITSDKVISFYKQATGFYNNSVIASEKANTLNMINVIFIQDKFDPLNLKDGIQGLAGITDNYIRYKTFLEGQLNLNKKENTNLSIFLENGYKASENYAGRLLMRDLNEISYTSSFNPYAYLRAKMNDMQARSIYFQLIEKENYKDLNQFLIKSNIYNEEYFAEIKNNVLSLGNSMYNNLSLSAAEIDNMLILTYYMPYIKYLESKGIDYSEQVNEYINRNENMLANMKIYNYRVDVYNMIGGYIQNYYFLTENKYVKDNTKIELDQKIKNELMFVFGKLDTKEKERSFVRWTQYSSNSISRKALDYALSLDPKLQEIYNTINSN